MVIGVFESDLHSVVVHVRNGKIVLDVVDAHRFKLEICHRTSCILSKRLVDADSKFGVLGDIAFNEVGGKDFFYNVHFCFHDAYYITIPCENVADMFRTCV